MSKKAEIIQKDDVTQAVLIADHYNDEFLPLSNDLPVALFPVVNRPLLDYSLEFLALGGIEQTYLFCSSHANSIKDYIKNGIEKCTVWSQTMEVIIIVSESCRSFGDCMRDLDAKGLLRGNFVLTEPGVVSNIKLLPIIKKHGETCKKDKSTAMTLIYQQSGIGQCPQDEVILAVNEKKRIFSHKRPMFSREKKLAFPLEIFLENSEISLHRNLKDTHIAICSPNVLPLFTDNFDYQTRDDFIKGLLMIDEILDATLYFHTIGNDEHGTAITNWKSYKIVCHELVDRWFYPIVPQMSWIRNYEKVAMGKGCKIGKNVALSRSIIGEGVIIGNNVTIEDSIVLRGVKIDDNCVISYSFISMNAVLKQGVKASFGTIVGDGVVIEETKDLRNALVQAIETDEYDCEKIGTNSFIIKPDEISDETSTFSRLHFYDMPEEDEFDFSDSDDSDDENLSYGDSPIPDDTKMFLTEVTDSLARGFEDKLQCDNLILEINSSRYAYNVTLREVHYNVVKAILTLPSQQSAGQPYLQALLRSLQYFSPILKNYVRNVEAMEDCLQAIQDYSEISSDLNENVMKVINWFYSKDHLSEESILKWFESLNKTSSIRNKITPFIKWLQEAEEEDEESTEDEE